LSFIITDGGLLILMTIIDLALLNLKQMLEVLTAQLLGLGVRSYVTMDEMKTSQNSNI